MENVLIKYLSYFNTIRLLLLQIVHGKRMVPGYCCMLHYFVNGLSHGGMTLLYHILFYYMLDLF